MGPPSDGASCVAITQLCGHVPFHHTMVIIDALLVMSGGLRSAVNSHSGAKSMFQILENCSWVQPDIAAPITEPTL